MMTLYVLLNFHLQFIFANNVQNVVFIKGPLETRLVAVRKSHIVLEFTVFNRQSPHCDAN
jgi:hypothetical protein